MKLKAKQIEILLAQLIFDSPRFLVFSHNQKIIYERKSC